MEAIASPTTRKRSKGQFIFPDTGTVVELPDRRTGTVTIRGRLSGDIAIVLRVPRAALITLAAPNRFLPAPGERLEAVRWRVADSLGIYAEGAPSRPSGERELLVDGLNQIRVNIRSEDLVRLNSLLDEPSGYPRLRAVIGICLLPEDLLRLATRPPRGREKAAWGLKRALPFAFLLAEDLALASDHDVELRRRIDQCLSREPWAEHWQQYKSMPPRDWRRAMRFLLVDRAFHGAWERCRVQPPRNSADPVEFLRSHVYGRESDRLRQHLPWVKQHDPEWGQFQSEVAKSFLLNAPGAAARAYRLLT